MRPLRVMYNLWRKLPKQDGLKHKNVIRIKMRIAVKTTNQKRQML